MHWYLVYGLGIYDILDYLPYVFFKTYPLVTDQDKLKSHVVFIKCCGN